MPINPKLKAQLEAMTMADDYRTKLIASMEDAPPEVQNLWMAQDDYTKKSNEYKRQMDDFYAKSNVAVATHEQRARDAETARVAAEARIAELEGRGSGTPAQEDAIAKELAGLKTLVTGLDGKLNGAVTEEKLNQAYQAAVGFIGEQMLDLDEISASHQAVFGTRFDRAERTKLIQFANEQAAALKHPVSLEEAYKLKFGAELEKQKEAAMERKYEEKYKSLHSIPGGGEGAAGGIPTEKGPAQIRIEQERNRQSGSTDPNAAGYTTWQEAAAAAGSELVKEGKY